MKIWIDTEFNSYQGELISIALVDEDVLEFYGVLACHEPNPWVAQHVIPVLGRPAESRQSLVTRMGDYLHRYHSIQLIADWPDDIRHFCDLLVTGPGVRINTPPLTMQIDRTIDSEKSTVPHNSLHDAIALRKCWYEKHAMGVM